MPSALTIARSSTPARMTMPVRVFCSQSQSAAPITSASSRMISRSSEYCTSSTCRLTKWSILPGPGDALGDAAEVVEHLVGEDDRDRDRDQRLAQVLALVPAQQDLLHDHADDADEQRADDERHAPS